MKTSTTFVKGQKRLGQGKRGPGKVTLAARAALVEFADGNAHRLQGWLDQIEAQDGPAAALSALLPSMGGAAGAQRASMRSS